MYFTNKAVKVSRTLYIAFFADMLINRWTELNEGDLWKKICAISKKTCEKALKADGEKIGGSKVFYFNSGQVTKWMYMIDLYETALIGPDRDKKIIIAAELLFKFLFDLNTNIHIRPDYLTYAYSRKLPPKDGIQGRKRHIDLTEEEREFINNLPQNTVKKDNETKFLQSN